MSKPTFELHIKYDEKPRRTEVVKVSCDIQEAFNKANAIYRSDNLGLIYTVRVHALGGKCIGGVKRISLRSRPRLASES